MSLCCPIFFFCNRTSNMTDSAIPLKRQPFRTTDISRGSITLKDMYACTVSAFLCMYNIELLDLQLQFDSKNNDNREISVGAYLDRTVINQDHEG